MIKRLFNIREYLFAFKEVMILLTKHRQLTLAMTKREIGERYAGQVLGVIWAIGHPIILIGVYLFIFAFVFKARVGGTVDLPFNYTVYILSGLIPWMSFQESMSKGSTVIIGNANLVKQVVFPIEVLPVKGVLASLLTQFVASLVLILYVLIRYHHLFLTYLLWPFIVFFQVLAMIGISYILSAVGCYFRDIKDFVQVFSIIGIYMMPVVYLPMWVPSGFRPILYLNPFSYMIWCYQDALYYGRFEHWWAWPVYIVGSLAIFCIGYKVFKRSKIYFGNVL
jgi:lipopolysaccharide transport system permease protein